MSERMCRFDPGSGYKGDGFCHPFFVPGAGVEPSLCLGALPLLYLRISGCEILKYRRRRYSLCLGALPLLYPAAPPSVFAFGKYTAPAVALEREYEVEL